MKFSGFLMTLVIAGATVLVAQAQERNNEALLEELFSTGTHAYYAGEYRRAYELLSEAIEGGLEDARVFYMRGVVLHALGRPEQGVRDFQRGAELEVRQQVEPQDINGFLSRIQGRLRVKLENVRRAERVKVLRRIQAERRARYQAMLQRQKVVSVPEDSGVDPLADQSELPPELASRLKRAQVNLTQAKPPAPPATAEEPSPQEPKEAGAQNAAAAQAGSKRPQAKPGTLQATARALGKAFSGLLRPVGNLPQGGLPLPGVGGSPAPAPQAPAPKSKEDPFDF